MLVHVGLVLTIVGWGSGLSLLLKLLWQDGGKTYHAIACWCALAFGFVGLLMVAAVICTAAMRELFSARSRSAPLACCCRYT